MPSEAQLRYWNSLKGKPSAVLGKHWKIKNKSNMFGHKMSNEAKDKISKFQKGRPKPHLKKLIAEKSPQWKGDNAGYRAIHDWIITKYGYPIFCEDCNKIGQRINGKWNIQWSSKDHKYTRNKEDYNGRCVKCHSKYDFSNNLIKYGRNKQHL